MSTARDRAEKLAAERHMYADQMSGSLVPKSSAIDLARREFKAGYLARDAEPVTVSAEQVEAATLEFARQTNVPYERMPSHHRYYWRQITSQVLRAAGFRVEGDGA